MEQAINNTVVLMKKVDFFIDDCSLHKRRTEISYKVHKFFFTDLAIIPWKYLRFSSSCKVHY